MERVFCRIYTLPFTSIESGLQLTNADLLKENIPNKVPHCDSLAKAFW